MLLFVVVAFGFVAGITAWTFWRGITIDEVAMLLALSVFIFLIHQKQIFKMVTTDKYLVSGYVTSLIYRPPFSYDCGRHRCHEPERFIIEQKPQRGDQYTYVKGRSIHGGDGIEACWGECKTSIPAPYKGANIVIGSGAAYSILVDKKKWGRAQVDGTSALWLPYFNPVKASDDIVYDNQGKIPYFKFGNYNHAERLIAPQATDAQKEELEKINARAAAYKVSIGLIVTEDNLYFEKLKHAWHQGKANDFVVVVYTPDGSAIGNVNVLAWNNEELKALVAQEVGSLNSADTDRILAKIEEAFYKGPKFKKASFAAYDYLDIKIPEKYYWRVILFQAVLYVYMLVLMRINPYTKDNKPTLETMGRVWLSYATRKKVENYDDGWDFHPLMPLGLLVHFAIPILGALLIWKF